MEGLTFVQDHCDSSRLTTAFASHLDISNFDLEEHTILRDAIGLRHRGRHLESLSHFQRLTQDVLKRPEVLNEHALSYYFVHNFDKLLELIGGCHESGGDTRETSFTSLLRSYALLHTDLMLTEAVMTSEGVMRKWLAGRSVNEYDDLDVYTAALCHEIQELGRRFLGNDDWDTQQSPAAEPLRRLRRHLLIAGRVEETLILHDAERRVYTIAEDISNLQEALTHCTEKHLNRGPALRLDISAWLHLRLAAALFINEQVDESTNQLIFARQNFEQSGNHYGCLWAEIYSVVLVKEGTGNLHLQILEELAEKSKGLYEWRAMQTCMFGVAKIQQKSNNFVLYHETIIAFLETTVEPAPHIASPASQTSRMNQNGKEEDTALQTKGSLFNFWEGYIGLMENDVSDSRYFGTVIKLCSCFFSIHLNCSMPQLQYLFSSTLSELYEERLGNPSLALPWAYKAAEYAKEAKQDGLEAEAQYRFRAILGGSGVKVGEDPHGILNQQYEEAKKRDFEILFQEAGEKGHKLEQLSYANDLLGMQLSAEVKGKVEISGEPWLSRAKSVLQQLSEEKQCEWRHRVDYSVAHAIFESGDSKAATARLSQLIDEWKKDNSKDSDMKLHASFTLGRAWLQAYQNIGGQIQWDLSRQVLEATAHDAMDQGKPDVAACCHCILADAWRIRGLGDQEAATKALFHISEAETLWVKERAGIKYLDGLDGLLTRYALRHRQESGPSDMFAIAYEACFGSKDFKAAWLWAQKAKARGYIDSLRGSEEKTPIPLESICMTMEQDGLNCIDTNLATLSALSGERGGIVCVEWVTADDIIYMITVRVGEKPLMHKLDIDMPTVRQWHSDLCSAKEDDFRNADDAAETLAEIDALCRPLSNPIVCKPGELLVLCPTKLLFKIPLHALNVGGDILLVRNPIVYTYALSVLHRCFVTAQRTKDQRILQRMTLFGDPTGDTPGGARSVTDISKSIHAEAFIASEATRERFTAACSLSRLIHYHGHVTVHEHELNHTLNFSGGTRLAARHASLLDLHQASPFICLIGCGSGIERIDLRDEPLGFISTLLYAGASTVLATLWPIHDVLSGEAFSRKFYEEFAVREGQQKVVDLARSLQKAALAIRNEEKTRAPYFWAGFVLHGRWTFET